MLGLDAVIWIQILPAFSNNLNAGKYLLFEFTFDYRKSMGIHITQTNTLQWKSSHAKEDQKRTQIEMLIMGFKGKSFQFICRYLLMYWIKMLRWKTTEFQMLITSYLVIRYDVLSWYDFKIQLNLAAVIILKERLVYCIYMAQNSNSSKICMPTNENAAHQWHQNAMWDGILSFCDNPFMHKIRKCMHPKVCKFLLHRYWYGIYQNIIYNDVGISTLHWSNYKYTLHFHTWLYIILIIPIKQTLTLLTYCNQ